MSPLPFPSRRLPRLPLRPATFVHPRTQRYTTGPAGKTSASPSRHASFYSDLIPAMIPVALLGSALYLGLRLLQASLLHEKFLDEARERVMQLEAEVESLREAQNASQTPGMPISSQKADAGGSHWKLW